MIVTTNTSRLLWGHVLSPFNGPSHIPRFKAEILISKSDTETLAQIDAGIAEASAAGKEERWKDAKTEHITLPMRDGDKPRIPGEKPNPICAGCMVISASNYKKPKVFDIRMQPIDDPKEIYNGIYICASLRFVPYIYEGVPGVRCILGPLMKVCDGAPIVERTPAEYALLKAAKKLHRHIISGMTYTEPPHHTDDDIPHDPFRNRSVSLEEFRQLMQESA